MSLEPVGANGCGYNVLLCPVHYGHNEGSAACHCSRLEGTAAATDCFCVSPHFGSRSGMDLLVCLCAAASKVGMRAQASEDARATVPVVPIFSS